MQSFLMNSYYSGMTIDGTLKLYESCHSKQIPSRSVDIAKRQIKNDTGKDWE